MRVGSSLAISRISKQKVKKASASYQVSRAGGQTLHQHDARSSCPWPSPGRPLIADSSHVRELMDCLATVLLNEFTKFFCWWLVAPERSSRWANIWPASKRACVSDLNNVRQKPGCPLRDLFSFTQNVTRACCSIFSATVNNHGAVLTPGHGQYFLPGFAVREQNIFQPTCETIFSNIFCAQICAITSNHRTYFKVAAEKKKEILNFKEIVKTNSCSAITFFFNYHSAQKNKIRILKNKKKTHFLTVILFCCCFTQHMKISCAAWSFWCAQPSSLEGTLVASGGLIQQVWQKWLSVSRACE